tara:strand:+ start:40 stop:972 length:933 start_codon:yes stop_codon:yes gene_type:complete
MTLPLIFLFSILGSSLFLIIFLPLLKQKIIDKPNKRSSHFLPKPSGGGISFVLVGTTLTLMMGNYIPLISLPLAIVGLIDDYSKITRRFRLFIQLFTVIILVSISPQISSLLSQSTKFLTVLILFFLILLGTAIINFFNFMDGMDGLLAGNMIIIFSMAAFLFSGTYLFIVGPLIGFLIFNWPPAKVFMGDVGSTFLGSIFFGLILTTNNFEDFIKLILLSSPILGDAFICVIRRFIKKQKIFEPHKLHLYQRLNQKGWSHGLVSLLYISCTLLIAITMLLGNLQIMFLTVCSLFLLGMWLEKTKAAPFI